MLARGGGRRQVKLGWNYPPGVLSWDLGLFISLAAVL